MTRPHLNTTTRRYPRSTREAFPRERFPAIERGYRPTPRFDKWAGYALAVVLGVSFAIALIEGVAR
jgi:hypothetical protein